MRKPLISPAGTPDLSSPGRTGSLWSGFISTIRLSVRTERLFYELIPFLTKTEITQDEKLSILPISANPGSNGLNIFNPSSLTTNSFGHFKKLQKSSRAHVHPFPGDTFISLILAREIISSQEYQTSKFQKTDKLIEFSILDLAKNSPLLIDFESISLFFVE